MSLELRKKNILFYDNASEQRWIRDQINQLQTHAQSNSLNVRKTNPVQQ